MWFKEYVDARWSAMDSPQYVQEVLDELKTLAVPFALPVKGYANLYNTRSYAGFFVYRDITLCMMRRVSHWLVILNACLSPEPFFNFCHYYTKKVFKVELPYTQAVNLAYQSSLLANLEDKCMGKTPSYNVPFISFSFYEKELLLHFLELVRVDALSGKSFTKLNETIYPEKSDFVVKQHIQGIYDSYFKPKIATAYYQDENFPILELLA